MNVKPYLFLVLLLTAWSCLQTEKEIAVTGVLLSSLSQEMIVGDTMDLTAKVSPENASNKSVTWSSSVPEVASVDEQGHVTAIKEGTADIIARAGAFSGICKVQVSVPSPGIYVVGQKVYKYNPREEQISIYSAEGNSWYRFLFPSTLTMYQIGPVPDNVATGGTFDVLLETYTSGVQSTEPMSLQLKVKYMDGAVMVLSSAGGDMIVLRY